MHCSSFKARICKVAVLAVVVSSCLIGYTSKLPLDDASFHRVELSQTSMIGSKSLSKKALTSPHAIQQSGNETERFHIVLTFALLNVTLSKENERMMEYIHCLKEFLNNKHVKQVHLMYDSPEMPGYIQKNAGSHRKLMLHQVDSPDVVLTLHQFAFTHLQGELVIITQADIILGEGFEKVNKSLLVENKLMYALSYSESKCSRGVDHCKTYTGAHHMFIFVPEGNLPAEEKSLLNHGIFNRGSENLVMYIYQNMLNYSILNPCRILRIYHNHCSTYRKSTTGQRRVNVMYNEISEPVDRMI